MNEIFIYLLLHHQVITVLSSIKKTTKYEYSLQIKKLLNTSYTRPRVAVAQFV